MTCCIYLPGLQLDLQSHNSFQCRQKIQQQLHSQQCSHLQKHSHQHEEERMQL